MYSHRVLEQFQNTKRVGELPDADAYVQVDNPACGDVLRITVKVAHGKIVDARFRVRGCVAAVACGAQLVDMMCGRSLAEVRAIKREEILAALDGLPETSLHASHLAMDALGATLKQLGLGAALSAGK
jgi:nitrogen fixation NifU-like protein